MKSTLSVPHCRTSVKVENCINCCCRFPIWPPDGTIHHRKVHFLLLNIFSLLLLNFGRQVGEIQKPSHTVENWNEVTVTTAHYIWSHCFLPGGELKIHNNREHWCHTKGPCVPPKPVGSFSTVKLLLDLTDQQAERADIRDAQTSKFNINTEIQFGCSRFKLIKKKKCLFFADFYILYFKRYLNKTRCVSQAFPPPNWCTVTS